MKRKETPYFRYQLYINAALIAAHANLEAEGIRQKDLRFYLELLSNWMETSFSQSGILLENTQIQRILDDLSEQGLMKREKKGRWPSYRFTSIGVLEIVTRLVGEDLSHDLEGFFFLYHCVSLYSQKIETMLFARSEDLPESYRLEIKHLLNAQTIIEKQRRSIELKIKKLQARINDALKMTDLAQKMVAKKRDLTDIAKVVEKNFPYQLNNQRKMQELFAELSPDIKRLELTEGPALRAETLWEPLLEHYHSYHNLLSNLEKQCNAKV